jgi:Rieske 2Fe-2S family protein
MASASTAAADAAVHEDRRDRLHVVHESPFAADEIAGVLRPLGEATTLPARAYTDPDVLAFERERWFWGGDWVCVGRASDAAGAGTWFVASAGGAEVLVVGGDDGVARAFHNVCPHRGTALLEGCGVRAASLRCPYHGWVFDLQGRVQRAPCDGARGLRPIRLESFGGFLFVNLAGDAPSLATWLDDLPAQLEGIPLDDLALGRRVRYRVRANWKLLMENFAEAYHFGPVHPELERLTPSRLAESLLSRGPWQGGWMPLVHGAETVSLDGRRHGRALLRARGVQPHGTLDYVLFPNLFLSLQPDYLLAYRLAPLSHQETTVDFDVLFARPRPRPRPPDGADGADGPADAPDVYDFWHATNAQDFAICERQQRGVASPRYAPSAYTAQEEGVHEFDKIVAARYAEP